MIKDIARAVRNLASKIYSSIETYEKYLFLNLRGHSGTPFLILTSDPLMKPKKWLFAYSAMFIVLQ